MTMTDPVADMLTRIRNANVAFHDDVVMPSSKLKVELAKILEQEGYITGSSVEDEAYYTLCMHSEPIGTTTASGAAPGRCGSRSRLPARASSFPSTSTA